MGFFWFLFARHFVVKCGKSKFPGSRDLGERGDETLDEIQWPAWPNHPASSDNLPRFH